MQKACATTERGRQPVALVLILALFAQTLLPLQLHAAFVHDDDGVPVVVCTLQGTSTVVVDLDGHSGDRHGAAMQFSDLLFAAAVGMPAVSVHEILMEVAVDANPAIHPPLHLHVSDSAIRAPPVLV